MPKSTTLSKNNTMSEDELTFTDSDDEQTNVMTEQPEDEQTNVMTEQPDSEDDIQEYSKKSNNKVSSHDIISSLDEIHNELLELSQEFKEKTTTFKNIEKVYLLARKDLEKQQQALLKKLGKTINTRSKVSKKRDPSTIGGFNKKTQVPTCICNYLKLDEDNQILSRPEVVALLKTSFEEKKYVNSETKEIIIPNKQLKKFGLPTGYVFKGNRYQSFLKVIYDDFKKQSVSI